MNVPERRRRTARLRIGCALSGALVAILSPALRAQTTMTFEFKPVGARQPVPFKGWASVRDTTVHVGGECTLVGELAIAGQFHGGSSYTIRGDLARYLADTLRVEAALRGGDVFELGTPAAEPEWYQNAKCLKTDWQTSYQPSCGPGGCGTARVDTRTCTEVGHEHAPDYYDVKAGATVFRCPAAYAREVRRRKLASMQDSLETLTRAVQANARDTAALLRRARSYVDIARYYYGAESDSLARKYIAAAIQDCDAAALLDERLLSARGEIYKYRSGTRLAEPDDSLRALHDHGRSKLVFYERRIAAHPKEWDSYYFRAEALVELGERERALADYEVCARKCKGFWKDQARKGKAQLLAR